MWATGGARLREEVLSYWGVRGEGRSRELRGGGGGARIRGGGAACTPGWEEGNIRYRERGGGSPRRGGEWGSRELRAEEGARLREGRSPVPAESGLGCPGAPLA